jgi:hypothetical protein
MDERRELVPPRAPAGGAAPPSTARLAFRLCVGGTALTAQWCAAALRAVDELPPGGQGQGDDGAGPDAAGARAVLVGALSSALRWRPPLARLEDAALRARRASGRGLGLLSNVPGARFARRRYARARDGLAARLAAWAEEGAREERAGRRLARRVTPVVFELAAARFAESPELRLVIEQQSEGLAASSIGELRARAEHADGAVERAIRRVLRRPPRP